MQMYLIGSDRSAIVPFGHLISITPMLGKKPGLLHGILLHHLWFTNEGMNHDICDV